MEHMNQSMVSSNPSLNSEKRKRKKKFQTKTPTEDINFSTIEWKSDTQQQIYSSKLLCALRQVRGASAGTPSALKRFREAADRVLAATAKGRTRWSRAILTNKLRIKFMKKSNIVKRERNVMTVITTGSSSSSSSSRRRKSKVSVMRLRSKGMPAVQRKGRVLGRLVPGCRKESLPVVLEEATDYIAALEMQVRAMSALTELLSASGSSSSSSTSAHNLLSSIGTPPS